MALRPDTDASNRLAQLVTLMRRFGLGERVLKTALAAGLAWQIAVLIPGNDYPYLAPVSAVLLMQLTIAQSLDHALQRNIGVAIGVIVAVLAFDAFGVHPWSISLVVLIALAGGIQLRLSQQAVQQVAITALIVLLAGSVNGTFEYATFRIIDSLIGSAVALGLNWLVVPPIYVKPASTAIERMSQDLSLALADLTASLRHGLTQPVAEQHLETARSLATSLANAHAAMAQAEQSLRYNRFARDRHAEIEALRKASLALEHSAIQTRVMCRSIVTAFQEQSADWLEPGIFGEPLADLFGRNTALVRYVGGDRTGVRPDVASTVELQHAMRDYWREHADRGWLYAGEVLTVAERMSSELHLAINELTEPAP